MVMFDERSDTSQSDKIRQQTLKFLQSQSATGIKMKRKIKMAMIFLTTALAVTGCGSKTVENDAWLGEYKGIEGGDGKAETQIRN